MLETAEICVIDDPFTHKSARPSVKVWIEGFSSIALFDSGAKITAISRNTFVKLSQFLAEKGVALKSVNIPPIYVISASSHKALVTQAYFVPFFIEGEYKSWRVLVLENLSSDVILGQDFLSFYGAKLCCRTHKITWEKPLRKIPPPDFCLTNIPRLYNKFQALAMLSASESGEKSLSFQSSSPPFRYPAKRVQKKKQAFMHAIRYAKQKCNSHMPIEAETHVVYAYDQITIPPLSSKLCKVGVSSIDGKRTSFPRKTIGTIESDPILSQKEDVFCVEGLSNAIPSKEGAFTFIQLTNVSSEYKFYEPKESIAAFVPLEVGSELYDISVIKAAASVPVVPTSRISKEKAEYLSQSVKISSPPEYQERYKSLVMEFHDVFASSKDDIGHTDLVTHKIHLKNQNQVPIYKKQFPIPWSHQEFINKKVDDMLKQGVIEESHSPYNSPVFAVKKPHSNDLRLVVDMREVNRISHCTNFRVRCVQECVDEISKHESSIFSTLDISSAFYQISLDKNSRPLTSFTIPGKGSFMFTRLPMGLHGSPASLSRVTNFIVRDLPSVIAYLDDLIGHSKDHEIHLDLLKQLFLRLRRYGLKLQAKKTVLGAESVTYLGYQISKNGIQPGEEKVEAIKNFPPPQSVKQIRQFCGLANYFRHMIPNFSRKSGQLTKLIQKNSDWKSGILPPESLTAFQSLKTDLSSFPLLSFPDPRKTFHVFTDGAIGGERETGGLGAVLCQKNEQGRLQPVAYASRSLHSNEKNYSAFLIEMSAIVFAIQHWHTYLYGRFFYVYCDHKPIEKLGTVHKKTMNRLQELMLEYNFELKYNPGANNGPADALSRNPISSLGTDVDIPLAQSEDPFCEAMCIFLMTGKKPVDPSLRQLVLRNSTNCSLADNGTLLYNLDRKQFVKRRVVVVPQSFQQPLIRAAHSSRLSGHLGVFKTVNRLFMNYWWPGIQDQVAEFIKECANCQMAKTPPKFKREVLPSHPLPILDAFNERVHIDTIGKMRGTRNPWLLVMTCAFSKYVVAVPIQKRDAETQAQAIYEHWVCRFGSPKTIVHDGDPAYCGELFQKLCKLLGTKTIQISSYHCQSNGGVEVYNKVFQGILRSLLQNPSEPYEPWLPAVSLAYNTSVNQATNASPFFLLYGCDPNLPQFDNLNVSPYNIDFPAERLLRMAKAHSVAKDQLKLSAEKNKKYYDRFAKECSFQLGERCLLHFPRTVCLQGHSKFFKQWHPVVVTRVLNCTTYMVRKLGRARAQRESIVHANRLKKFFPIEILPGFVQSHPALQGEEKKPSPSSPSQQNRPGSCLPPPPCLETYESVSHSWSNSEDKNFRKNIFAASPALVWPNNEEANAEASVDLPVPDLSSSSHDSDSDSSSSSSSSFASLGSPEPAAEPPSSPPRSSAAAAASAPRSSAAAATCAAPRSSAAPHSSAAASYAPRSSAAAPRSSAAASRSSAAASHAPRSSAAAASSASSSSEARVGRAVQGEGGPLSGVGPQPSGGRASRLIQSTLGPLAEGLYGPSRPTRSNSSAPPIQPTPKVPLEYKRKK